MTDSKKTPKSQDADLPEQVTSAPVPPQEKTAGPDVSPPEPATTPTASADAKETKSEEPAKAPEKEHAEKAETKPDEAPKLPKKPAKILTDLGESFFLPDHGKKPVLLHLLAGWPNQMILIFVRSRYRANRLTALVRNQGLDALVLHGERNQKVRRKVANRFSKEGAQVLVTTESGLRGVELNTPQQVVQFDLPHKAQTVAERCQQFPDSPLSTLYLERDQPFMASIAKEAGVAFIEKDWQEFSGFAMPQAPEPPAQDNRGENKQGKSARDNKPSERDPSRSQKQGKKKKNKHPRSKPQQNAYGIPGAFDPGDQRRFLRKYKEPKAEPLDPNQSRQPFGRAAHTQGLAWKRHYDGPGLLIKNEQQKKREDINGNVTPAKEKRILPPDNIGNKRRKNDRRQASIAPFGRPPERGNAAFRRTISDPTLPQPSPLDETNRRDGYRTISPPAPASARRPVDKKTQQKNQQKTGRMKRRFSKKRR